MAGPPGRGSARKGTSRRSGSSPSIRPTRTPSSRGRGRPASIARATADGSGSGSTSPPRRALHRHSLRHPGPRRPRRAEHDLGRHRDRRGLSQPGRWRHVDARGVRDHRSRRARFDDRADEPAPSAREHERRSVLERRSGETWTPIGVQAKWPLHVFPRHRGEDRAIRASCSPGCGETTSGRTDGCRAPLEATAGKPPAELAAARRRPNATMAGLATHPADPSRSPARGRSSARSTSAGRTESPGARSRGSSGRFAPARGACLGLEGRRCSLGARGRRRG